MTTTAKVKKFASLGDRFAEISVLLLTLIALLLGWLLKSGVENRSVAFQSENITAQTPAGWMLSQPGGEEVLAVTDRTASGYSTNYLIEVKAVSEDAELGQVVSLLTLERGSKLTGYRVLNQQEVLIDGRKAAEIEYVYVESDANLTHAVLPAVVHGLDYIFINNGQAVIVIYRADQSVYEADLGRFYRFLASVDY